jgi:putative DNA primase/helicase
VLVVEGEKTSEAAAQLFPDVLVTTPPHGAMSPHKVDWTPLKGRIVVIWPDRDQAGSEYAKAVQRLAGEAAADVRVVRVPADFPAKWDLADPLPDGWTPQRLRDLVDAALAAERRIDANGNGDKTPPKDSVPAPFRLTNSAAEYWLDDDDGEGEWQFVCSRLEVGAVTRNADSEDWGRLLRLTDRDGTVHEWPMPMEMLAGSGEEYRRRLLSMGLEIAPGRSARDRLHCYISTCRPSERARCVARIGWHGKAFVLPDATLGETQGERILLQTVGSFDHAFRMQGTLPEWQQRVAGLTAGNSRSVLSISAAFAAPLLHVVGAESGGFHLRGQSSIGKTTALAIAGSVWGGGGVAGYVRQWRATDNGLEAVAQAHCDALLCLDELSQIDAKAAGAAAYMLANGAGKARAGRGGEGRTPAAWRLLFLSSGEIGIADKVAEDGRGRKLAAGQQVRVIDIPADAGVGFGSFENLHGFESADALARHLKHAAEEHYGTAGRAFLAEVATKLEEVRNAVAGFKADFVREHCPAGADGQVSRVAARFALVGAAGELATAVGIVPWGRGEALKAAAACLRAWLEARGGIQPAEVTAGLAQVRQFIERHGEARFAPWGGDDGDRPTINRAGFRKSDGAGGVEYFVLPEVWRSEVCAGFDPGALVRVLVERGLLIPDAADGKPQSRHRLPGSRGPLRCYRLSASILGGDDSA